MQLQFNSEEIQLLADILEERDEGLRLELSRTQEKAARDALEKERHILSTVESQILERDLDFSSEELDMLGAVVAQCERELENERALLATDSPQLGRLEILRYIRDRLAETCAMF